jgi:beta-lactamase class A
MLHELKRHASAHRRNIAIGIGATTALIILVQLFYPGDRLPLNATVDGLNVSGWNKQDAAWELNQRSKQARISVRLSGSDRNYQDASAEAIGLTIDNRQRIDDAGYPWWARLIPTSIAWYGLTMNDGSPRFESDESKALAYLNTTLGDSCDIPAKNATLELRCDSLEVISAKPGGTCEQEEALAALTSVRPEYGTPAVVEIPVDVKAPKVGDTAAKKVASVLNERASEGVRLTVGDTEQRIPATEVLSWLSFTSKGSRLDYSIDPERSGEYLARTVTPKVSKPAGVTKIATRDFTIVSEEKGSTGQTLDLPATLEQLTGVLDGTQKIAKASTRALAPKTVYSRSYTKTSTGIAALLRYYDEDTAGTFGVSFQELGGRGLAASHNASQRFTTASTYKLFVAYGTLRKVDAGKWKWSDTNVSGGRSLSTCFNDMIVKSDNACAEELLKRLGFRQLTEEIQKLGLSGSGFLSGGSPHTTAGDLSLLLSKLQSGSLPIKSDSRARLLDAMKRNIYRQGIPAGASGQAADKVGFLWGLLHDAAIVYSPKGTYVLVILTDGSSWSNIAELTKKIEALR